MTSQTTRGTTDTPWANRIVGHADVDPVSLVANPKNWRLHPDAQKKALSGALLEVGWVAQIIVNKRTGHIVDGHARIELAIDRKETTVPVVYVDLAEEEEATVLGFLDPLSAMAQADPEKLDALMAEITVNDEALREMFAGMKTPDFAAMTPDEQGRLDISTKGRQVTCPECGHVFPSH